MLHLFSSLAEAARTLVLRAPRWERVQPSAWHMALLMLLAIACNAAFQHSYLEAGALFDWAALTRGWCAIALLAWGAWSVRARTPGQPHTAQIVTVLLAQLALIAAVSGLAFSLIPDHVLDRMNEHVYFVVFYLPAAWTALAQLVLLLRSSTGSARLLSLAAVALATIATVSVDPVTYWPDADKADASADGFAISQEVFEAQAPLLDEQLDALKPQRPGIVDMYSITFAPYEGQEVFRRESAMVTDVMEKRFDTTGRSLQLINHRDTADTLPWATPLNLQRAIEGIAERMDPDEDILFIHLTSHGASNGELAAQFAPMQVAPVLPQELRRWLDHAGVRYRVLSISACYAGNWIAPLSADGTLVMTASDANHTSYGCGSKSDLTFFGRAMYDEQLRSTTHSFTDAHAAARKVILQRENEAGKDDGYSNPQIKVGKLIEARLALQREQACKAGSCGP